MLPLTVHDGPQPDAEGADHEHADVDRAVGCGDVGPGWLAPFPVVCLAHAGSSYSGVGDLRRLPAASARAAGGGPSRRCLRRAGPGPATRSCDGPPREPVAARAGPGYRGGPSASGRTRPWQAARGASLPDAVR